MKFLGEKCSYCGKVFTADDDIVVCPECGTPQHRECYEQNLNSCINSDLHNTDFVFEPQESIEKNSNEIICPICKTKNEKDSAFCKKCGSLIGNQSAEQRNTIQNKENGFDDRQLPFFLDPLAGVSASEKLDNDITVGETAKYVQQNTPYFISVFNSIKKFGRSRFNFCAAIFSGGYLLYRKQYKLGAFITIIKFLMIFLSGLITNSAIYQNYLANNSPNYIYEYFFTLSTAEQLLFLLPGLFSFTDFAISIVLGFTANRLYFKHCKKKINAIKKEYKNNEDISKTLQTKGGVNVPLVISIFVAYIIIAYAINFLEIYGGIL